MLGVVVASVFFAASASAATTTLGKAGGLKYVRAQGSVAAAGMVPTSAVAQARCGASEWRTTGGGVALVGSARGSYLSQGSDSTHSWYGTGWHLAQPARTLSTFGVCSKNAAISHHVHIESIPQAPPTSFGSATIDCAPGHVLGGGTLATAGDSDRFINTTNPRDSGADANAIPDDGWQTYMTLLNGTGVSLLVYDICRNGPAPSYPQVKRNVDDKHALSVKARCTSGHVAGGGVYETGNPLTAHVASTRPIDTGDKDHIPDDGWSGTVFNDTGITQAVTVTAICIG